MKKEKRHNKIILTPEAMALREIRKEKGHTIKSVAEKIGKSESYLRHIETGRTDFPRKKVLVSILEVYGITYKVFRHKAVAIRTEFFMVDEREGRTVRSSRNFYKLPYLFVRFLSLDNG